MSLNVYIPLLKINWSRGSVVSIGTRQRAGRSGVRIPVGTRDVSLVQKTRPQWVQRFFPWGKVAGA
jgi:hypothetical protein